MFLIDTHSHIYQPAFDEDRDEMIQRAKNEGINKIFLPNIDLQSIPLMLSLCRNHPGVCYPMLGLHPCDVKEGYQRVLNEMRTLFAEHSFIAVGEVGIDLYWDKSTLPLQQEAFRIQIGWAKELRLPIVIHARDSFDEIFSILDELHDERLTGVFHCFTGNAEQAKRIMEYNGFMMGIGGVITYEKSGLEEVVADIPLEYLILETDAPYLTPKPFRGKRNESAYVKLVARKLAEAKAISTEEVAKQTSSNALSLFNKV
jgi:TatD DNase family protein